MRAENVKHNSSRLSSPPPPETMKTQLKAIFITDIKGTVLQFIFILKSGHHGAIDL
jgi:hypothetical protein